MKRNQSHAASVFLVLALAALLRAGPATALDCGSPPPLNPEPVIKLPDRPEFSLDGRTILYAGEPIRLSKRPRSYEAYSKDRNNLDPTEKAHIERLMTDTRIPSTYGSWKDAVDATFRLKFPGYGVWGLQPNGPPGSPELQSTALDIPMSGRSRFPVFLPVADGVRLIDDFVASDDLRLYAVGLRDGQLVYSNYKGAEVLTRCPLAP